MSTPLLDALLEHIRLRPAPFHMPGHKGRMEELEGLAAVGAMDVTELPDTGDLYEGDDVIAQAEALWSQSWDFPLCQFLTCGSTQGVHAALLLCGRWGKGTLVDRCCHRSVYNALGLCGLEPTYLMRRQDQPVTEPQLQSALERAKAAGREIATVVVTSPTYYGVLSDIPALARTAHRWGARLVVDAAHGCHLPFLGTNPYWSVQPQERPDLVVTSAHKTLPVYGQGALLFGSGAGLTQRDLRWAARVMGTSSPSYPVMASMDWARAQMEEGDGRQRLQDLAQAVRLFRASFPALDGADIDPLRLTLTLDAVSADGFQAKRRLEAMGVFPEMADRDHLVFLFSAQNTVQDLDRLRRGLEELAEDFPGVFGAPMEPLDPPEPEVVCLPAQALAAPRRVLPLREAEGLVAAQQVAPYPPGVPVIAPGERVSKKCLAYLREVGYNVQEDVDVLIEGEAGEQEEWGL